MRAFLTVAFLALSTTASADTISLGTVTINYDGAGAVDVASSTARYVGTVYAGDGVFQGWQLTPESGAPGALIDLSGYWVGLSCPGLLTIDGASHVIGSLESLYQATLQISAEVNAPFGQGDFASLTVPFGFAATFLSDVAGPVAMDGWGLATVLLSRYPGDAFTPSYWDFRSVTYSFNPVSENPEPATVVLALTGLLFILWRRYGVSTAQRSL